MGLINRTKPFLGHFLTSDVILTDDFFTDDFFSGFSVCNQSKIVDHFPIHDSWLFSALEQMK